MKKWNLNDLKPGQYIINTCNVIVTEGALNPMEKDQANWVAHIDFNDIQ